MKLRKLNHVQQRQIFLLAIYKPVMIITPTAEEAKHIKDNLLEFAIFRFHKNLHCYKTGSYINVRGIESIRIISRDSWVKDEYKLPFRGICLISDKSLAADGIPAVMGKIFTLESMYEKYGLMGEEDEHGEKAQKHQ